MSYQVMKRDFLQEKEVEEGRLHPVGGAGEGGGLDLG